MGKMLRCSVVLGAAMLIAAQNAGAAADDVVASYSSMALAKAAAQKLEIRDQPQVVIPARSARSRFETLVLDCEKITQAQRNLEEALGHGAQSMPLAPGKNASGPPASGAEIYHITQNQQRITALARKFNCARR